MAFLLQQPGQTKAEEGNIFEHSRCVKFYVKYSPDWCSRICFRSETEFLGAQ